MTSVTWQIRSSQRINSQPRPVTNQKVAQNKFSATPVTNQKPTLRQLLPLWCSEPIFSNLFRTHACCKRQSKNWIEANKTGYWALKPRKHDSVQDADFPKKYLSSTVPGTALQPDGNACGLILGSYPARRTKEKKQRIEEFLLLMVYIGGYPPPSFHSCSELSSILNDKTVDYTTPTAKWNFPHDRSHQNLIIKYIWIKFDPCISPCISFILERASLTLHGWLLNAEHEASY